MEFPTLPHPASSLDLNPIEHMGALVKQHLRMLPRCPTTENELWLEVVRAWDAIPMETVNRLVLSMEDRRRAVIQQNGRATGF